MLSESRRNLKSLVGTRLGPRDGWIDPARVTAFSQAVGDSGAQSVPPTYLTIFRDLEFALFDELGFSLSNVLHAEQDYALDRSLLPDLKFSYETVLANVLEKKGTAFSLTFLVVETTFRTVSSEVPAERIAFAKTTVVVREAHHD